jgi:protein RecA
MRTRLIEKQSSYYTKSDKALAFIHSGSTLLDLILGGGWPLRRVSNIVGDKSTGKTQLAIEAMINFINKYPKGIVEYQEVESAFDPDYAEGLGLPLDKIEILEDIERIDDTMKSVNKFLKRVEKSGVPGLRIIDTLDAIHDKDTEGLSEGFEKARRAGAINDMITSFVGKFKRANANLIIVSQIRENIGVMFGEKYKRAGGKAMDFYISQCLWLSELKKIPKTIDGEKRVVAIKVKAKCKKNKVGLPYRECEFPIVFGYGVDDIASCTEWLKSVDCLDELSDMKLGSLLETLYNGDDALNRKMTKLVTKKWVEIETKFLPKYKKYS